MSDQLRPDFGPVLAQLATANIGQPLDGDGSRWRNRAHAFEPLIDCWGLNPDLPGQFGLNTLEDRDGLPDARIGLALGGSFLSHRLTIRDGLTTGKQSHAELPYQATSGQSKAMLTGKELGQAIKKAIELKDAHARAQNRPPVKQADVARHFGVKPPSVQEWINSGTIHKRRLPELWLYFSDVVGPEHWGLASFPEARVPGSVFEEFTEEDRAFLTDFRLLPDGEQLRIANEVAQRAAEMRAYLHKQIPRFRPANNQTAGRLAADEQSVSNQVAPESRPAELFGIDELAESRDGHESSSKNNGSAHGKNHRRA